MSQPRPPYSPEPHPSSAQSQYGQAPYGQPQPGMPAQMPGVPMSTQPLQPSAPQRKHGRVLAIVIAVAAIAVVGIVIGVSALNRPTPASQAAAGQCIQDPAGSSSVYVTDCDAKDAAYKVTASGGTDCTTVSGTTTTYEDLCMIGLDEDPSISLAGVQEGDCLSIDTSTEEATTTECTSGTYPVLKVLTDVDDTDLGLLAGNEDACQAAGVDNDAYTSWYKWNFDYFRSDSGIDLTANTNDLVFCLGDPQP